jgi:hypothetical protein
MASDLATNNINSFNVAFAWMAISVEPQRDSWKMKPLG